MNKTPDLESSPLVEDRVSYLFCLSFIFGKEFSLAHTVSKLIFTNNYNFSTISKICLNYTNNYNSL